MDEDGAASVEHMVILDRNVDEIPNTRHYLRIIVYLVIYDVP